MLSCLAVKYQKSNSDGKGICLIVLIFVRLINKIIPPVTTLYRKGLLLLFIFFFFLGGGEGAASGLYRKGVLHCWCIYEIPLAAGPKPVTDITYLHST